MLRPSDTHKIDAPCDTWPAADQPLDETSQLAKTELLLRIHAHSDTRSTCYVLANEMRRAAESDRVIVLCRRGACLRVGAISNLDQFDVRSPVVRAAEQLAAIVDPDAGPQWFEEEPTNQDDSWFIRDYVEQSHSRTVALLPLCVPARDDKPNIAEFVGLIICERFSASPFELAMRRQLSELSQHAAVAVARAAALERVPFFRWLSRLSRVGLFSVQGSRTSHLLFAVAIIALLGFGAFWPVAFNVTGSGTLQPANRREIFAPADGIVHELRVKAGDQVAVGDILVELRNDELELELTRMSGELETNRRRLQTIQAARLEAVKPAEKMEPAGRLAAEEEQLKEMIRGLESQQAFRQKQREQLQVRSPISGQLLTWDVERLLRARPLRRGQRMMTVADLHDAWTLEIQVADADAGHVLAAMQNQVSPLTVSYRTAARPDQDHVGTLEKISDWTEVNDSGRPTVKMIAAIANPDALDARPGAMISASIHLGRRPRAYVWFREVIEYVRMHLWL